MKGGDGTVVLVGDSMDGELEITEGHIVSVIPEDMIQI